MKKKLISLCLIICIFKKFKKNIFYKLHVNTLQEVVQILQVVIDHHPQ